LQRQCRSSRNLSYDGRTSSRHHCSITIHPCPKPNITPHAWIRRCILNV
jgi:hypothetical protein